MKGLRKVTVALSLMLAASVFFPAGSAYAGGSHEGPQTTAAQAASAGDRTTMENFVLHAKHHLVEAVKDGRGELSAVYRQMRTKGTWKDESGSVYLIVLSDRGTVVNHGIHTKDLYGDSLAALPTVKNLLDMLEGNTQQGPVCDSYDGMDGDMKWSCAVEYDNTQGKKRVLIGGFNHAEDDPDIAFIQCPDYEPGVTARQVSESQSEEDLKNFVKEAIKRLGDLQKESSERKGENQNPVGKVCFGEKPWKSGPIYLFIMTKLPSGAPVVIVNGNNPEYTGSPFENVLDEDGVDIGAEILKVAGEPGKGGTVKYKWDNPEIDGDEVDMVGMSPGNSPKISYVEGATLPKDPGKLYIFGSGIYPQGGDGDGCAIAGMGNRSGSAGSSLLLAVFSLCLALRWKDRSKK